MMEVDHDAKLIYCEEMRASADSLGVMVPSEALQQRLTTPIVTTYIDTDKICFER